MLIPIQIAIFPVWAAPSIALRIPLIEISSSFLISELSDAQDIKQYKDGFLILGDDIGRNSALTYIGEKGASFWRLNPLGIQEGFITAMTVSGEKIFIAGLSQGALKNSEADSANSPLNQPSTPSPNEPAPSAPSTVQSTTVPLANPDNVIVIPKEKARENFNNYFLAELDSIGKVITLYNFSNLNQFIPNSIATLGTRIFLAGNEFLSENNLRGAVYVIDGQTLQGSYVYGSKATELKKVIVNSKNSLSIVGNSSETLGGKNLVGKIDAVAMNISATSGKIERVLRSSGRGAVRSWDSGSGNLLVAGTSKDSKNREGVITQFSKNGAVAWSARFQNSDQALVAGNCGSLSLLGVSKNLPFKPTGPEVFAFTIDSKGNFQRGLRVSAQRLISLAPTSKKGCALLTHSEEWGVRLSFL